MGQSEAGRIAKLIDEFSEWKLRPRSGGDAACCEAPAAMLQAAPGSGSDIARRSVGYSRDSAMKDGADFKVKDLSPRRLGAEGNRHRRDRDAGADGAPRRVRRVPGAGGRAHRRLPAHDDPDRRSDRDAEGAGGGGSLELLQHLLDPGPRRGRHGGRRRARLRLEGRDRGGIRLVHRPHHRGAPTAGAPT